jgi:hypothetical protein
MKSVLSIIFTEAILLAVRLKQVIFTSVFAAPTPDRG